MENVTDFDFYLKFTKPLILNLSQINDRVLAAAWVKRLSGSETDEKTKLDYLKLLLFMLQRKRLTKPFTQHPSSLETLEPIPNDQTLVDVAKKIIESEMNERRDKEIRRLLGERSAVSPYVSDFSADLLEYVAVQQIEDFGVHGYYAVSKEPLSTWYRVDKQLLPKAAKSMLEVSIPPPNLVDSRSTPDVSEKPKSPEKSPEPPVEMPPAEPPVEQPPEEPPSPVVEPPSDAEATPSPIAKKSPRKSSLGATPPSRPIGSVSPPPEDREPPSWGSNLLEAKFLDEDAKDIMKTSTTLEEFAPEVKPAVAAPMQVLWSSPPGDGGGSPFLFDDGDEVDLDTSMPSMLESSLTELAGSPTRPPPPPPKVVKRSSFLPKPKSKTRLPQKMTRAAQLLHEKKAKDLAPKPPSPWKKARDKAKLKAKKEAEKVATGFKGFSADDFEMYVPDFHSTVEDFDLGYQTKLARYRELAKKKEKSPISEAAPVDDVDKYINEYSKTLNELEVQYQEDLAQYRTPPTSTAVQPSTPKRHLSPLAKKSPGKIQKEHDEAVDLDESIHFSPESLAILAGISDEATVVAGPEFASGRVSPRLFAVEEEDEEEAVAEDSSGNLSAFLEGLGLSPSEIHPDKTSPGGYATTKPAPSPPSKEPEVVGYASPKSPPGSPSKDRSMISLYNSMYDDSLFDPSTSIGEEKAADLGGIDLGDLEVDVANISGGNLDAVMEKLQAEAPASPKYDYDDFEAMERAVEAEMRAQGEDPFAKPEKKASPKYDYDDFEAMERAVEAEMRAQGEDPFAKPEKKPMTRKQLRKSRQRFLGVHQRADEQMEDLEGWVDAPEFFEEEDKELVKKMTTPERLKFAFPDMEFEDESESVTVEDLLPDNISEEASPTGRELWDNMVFLYADFMKSCPATHGTPVTTPRLSASPKRFVPANQMWKMKYAHPPPGSRLKPLQLPPSPAMAEEEFLVVPTSPSQIIEPRYLPAFSLDWQSPEMNAPVLKELPQPPPDPSWISPENKNWPFEMMELHDKLFPNEKPFPTTEATPEKMIYKESPPRRMGSPPSPSPIDLKKLKSDIMEKYEAPPKNFLYEQSVGKTVVNRFSHPSEMARRPIMEEVEEWPSPEGPSFWEGLWDYMYFPTPPVVRPIEKLIDTSDEEDADYYTFPPPKPRPPASPPIDERQFYEDIQKKSVHPDEHWKRRKMPVDLKRAFQPGAYVRNEGEMWKATRGEPAEIRTYGMSPDLATYLEGDEMAEDEEFQTFVADVATAPNIPLTPERFKTKYKPPLSPIGDSPVEYPERTPRARLDIGTSPGEQRAGVARRRTSRKPVRKRRLDFDQPDESVEQVEPDEPVQLIATPAFPSPDYTTPVQDEFTPVTTRPRREQMLLERYMDLADDLPETPPSASFEKPKELFYTPGRRRRRVVPFESPLRRPKERLITKQLSKKKLEFDEPEEPSTHVEVEQLVTRVQRGPEKPPVDITSKVEPLFRSPNLNEMAPEAVYLDDEDMPEANLPPSSPISPMSEYGVLEHTIDELKKFKYEGPKKPPRKARAMYKQHPKLDPTRKSKDFYKRYPWKQLEAVPEQPLQEAVTRIHEGVEREVEAELAARTSPKRSAPAPAPLPGLEYETPPELQWKKPFQQPDYSVSKMADQLFQNERRTRRQTTARETQELAEFEQMEREIYGGSPNVLEAEAPPDYNQAAKVYDAARTQYDLLYSPPKLPMPPRDPRKRSHRAPPFQTVAELHEANKLIPPSPEFLRQQAEYEAAERAKAEAAAIAAAEAAIAAAEAKVKAEIEKKEKLKAAKAEKLNRLVRGGRAPVKVRSLTVAAKTSDKGILPRGKKGQKKPPPPPQPEKPKRKKKWDVPSKINTGRGKKAPVAPVAPAAPPPPPRKQIPLPSPLPEELNIEYDLAALQDLGLSLQDIGELDIDDEVAWRLEAEKVAKVPARRVDEYYKESDQPIDDEEPPEFDDFADFDESQPRSEIQAQEHYDPTTGITTKKLSIRAKLEAGQTSVLGAVGAFGGLDPAEEEAVEQATRAGSFGPDDYTWGGESPISEDLRGFKWMEKDYPVPEQWPPLDDEY